MSLCCSFLLFLYFTPIHAFCQAQIVTNIPITVHSSAGIRQMSCLHEQMPDSEPTKSTCPIALRPLMSRKPLKAVSRSCEAAESAKARLCEWRG